MIAVGGVYIVVKAVVAVVSEGGSTVLIRGVQHGRGLNQRNLGAGDGINGIISIAFKRAVVDLNSALISINGSTFSVLGGVALECAVVDLGSALKQLKLQEDNSSSIKASVVALEYGVVDLHIGTGTESINRESINSPPTIVGGVTLECGVINLKVTIIDPNSAAPVSAVGVEGRIMDDKSSTTNVDCPSIMAVDSVALKYAVMDLHIGTKFGINSSPLEVACPTPGNGAEISEKFQTKAGPITLTSVAELVSNVLV
jgi:hypothetical protein